MIRDEYSPYKVVHHPGKLQTLRVDGQPRPLQAQVVPTNVCNQRCEFCAYRMDGSLSSQTFTEKNSLSKAKLFELVDDFVDIDVRAVHYTGGGEPLTHPDIDDVFEYTISNGLEMALVTNGVMMSDWFMDEAIAETSWVRVSVDSSTAETYKKMRNSSDRAFDRVNNNLKRCAKNKGDSILGVGFVVNENNYREIYDAARYYKDIGVDNFRISAAFNPEGYKYFETFVTEAKHLARAAECLTDKGFTVFNLFDDRLKDIFVGVQDYDKCPIKDLLTYVGADYNVYTCCTLAYNENGLIGSIKDRSFRDLWFGGDKVLKFDDHNPKIHCKHPCMYKNKNEFINYCIKKDARHTNFI